MFTIDPKAKALFDKLSDQKIQFMFTTSNIQMVMLHFGNNEQIQNEMRNDFLRTYDKNQQDAYIQTATNMFNEIIKTSKQLKIETEDIISYNTCLFALLGSNRGILKFTPEQIKMYETGFAGSRKILQSKDFFNKSKISI